MLHWNFHEGTVEAASLNMITLGQIKSDNINR